MNTHNRRKPTNLSLDDALLSEARALDVNLSRAAENGIREEVRRAQSLRWHQENAQALASSNAHVEEAGLPLARYRRF